MSITVFIKTPDGTAHDVDIEGSNTVKDLYKKTAIAVHVQEDAFLLYHQETLLKAGGGEESEPIWRTCLGDGCEVIMQEGNRTRKVLLRELAGQLDSIEKQLTIDPDMVLVIDASTAVRLQLEKFHLPQGLRHLKVTAPTGCVTCIEHGFLRGCTTLITVDISNLRHLRAIGQHFLAQCEALQQIMLCDTEEDLRCVRGGFLEGCESLSSIDLSGLKGLTTIEFSFLAGCKGLTTVDLSPLSSVSSIGFSFLYQCSGLREIDLSVFTRLDAVESFFLCGCEGLTTVDLAPLCRVRSVGYRFMSRCTALASLDLSPLGCLMSIEDSFLSHNTSLTALDLAPLSSVITIGTDFAADCSALRCVDVTGLVNLQHVDVNFLGGTAVPEERRVPFVRRRAEIGPPLPKTKAKKKRIRCTIC